MRDMPRAMPRAGITLIAMLAAITIVSQFFRVSTGVIAPELVRDLALAPEMLGLANGAFMVALTAAQIPVGLLFDRYGARATVTVLSSLTVAGALLHVAATDGAALVVARAIGGFGCGGSFMAAVLLCSRWFPPAVLATRISWVFALSNIGTLMAATPLALASAAIGWRLSFAAAAVVTGLITLGFFALVRDRPPGIQAPVAPPARIGAVIRGLAEVWRSPGLLPVLAIHLFAYASLLTVLGLWAGPYLNDVHGLGGVARGNVLLAMGGAQLVGILCYGPMDRLFNSRKRVVVCGAVLTISVLAALAAIPDPPVWLAAALLVLLAGVTAYGIVIVAHGRGLFPDRLAGRGVTTVNLAQGAGTAILPIGTGWIVGAFPQTDGASPEAAYRLAFAAIAVCLACGLAVYSRARDVKPRAAG